MYDTVDKICHFRSHNRFPISPHTCSSSSSRDNRLLTVSVCPENSCHGASGSPQRLTTGSGYIASYVTSTTGCGSTTCPWLLEPAAGQRFNLTFFSYHLPDDVQQTQSKYCHRFATVVDRTTQVTKDVTVCGKDPRVIHHTTNSAQIELKLFTGSNENEAYFVVHYEGEDVRDELSLCSGFGGEGGGLSSQNIHFSISYQH